MRQRRVVAALLALALLPRVAPTQPAARAQLEALRQADVRVATIGYRLVTAAAPMCGARVAVPGIVVATASQYRGDMRAVATDLFGLQRGAAITGVVAGSVAARAGAKAGDRLLSINGQAVASAAPQRLKADGDEYGALVDSLAMAFAAGPVALGIERVGRPYALRFTGAPACPTNFQLVLDNKLNALADGKTVSVTARLADFTPDDDELAFVLAHELAHNILRHREQLDAGKRSTLDTEMEADYYGVHIMAMAGYDPSGAPAFWERMRGTRGFLWIPAGHLGDKRRIAFLQAAADEVAQARASGGSLWPDYVRFLEDVR